MYTNLVYKYTLKFQKPETEKMHNLKKIRELSITGESCVHIKI